MSPLHDNRFAGHLQAADPRGPLSAAGGCVWPTVPAFRYQLRSNDATQELRFLNHRPILLQFSGPQPSHDAAPWFLARVHPDVPFAVAIKQYTPGESTYKWSFSIGVDEFPGNPLVFFVVRPIETCNRTIPLPNVEAWDPASGETGNTFRMEQVEWNRESPPPA